MPVHRRAVRGAVCTDDCCSAAVDLIYRLTGRVWYVTATNLAFCRERWPGYDVRLTQGGDELDLLRKLRRSGVVAVRARQRGVDVIAAPDARVGSTTSS